MKSKNALFIPAVLLAFTIAKGDYRRPISSDAMYARSDLVIDGEVIGIGRKKSDFENTPAQKDSLQQPMQIDLKIDHLIKGNLPGGITDHSHLKLELSQELSEKGAPAIYVHPFYKVITGSKTRIFGRKEWFKNASGVLVIKITSFDQIRPDAYHRFFPVVKRAEIKPVELANSMITTESSAPLAPALAHPVLPVTTSNESKAAAQFTWIWWAAGFFSVIGLVWFSFRKSMRK